MERKGARERRGGRKVAGVDKQCCSGRSHQLSILIPFEEVMTLTSHTEVEQEWRTSPWSGLCHI